MGGDAATEPSVSGRDNRYVFMAGAVSGVVEGVCVQPLEMVKTRFQINTGHNQALWPALREIVREGGIRQLYRGGLPEIGGLMPRATAALSTLEFTQRWFRSRHGGDLPAHGAYISGAAAGVSEGVAFSPFQVIKVRLMAKEHLGRYHNTWHCLKEVVSQEGPQALLIGLAPTLLRNCVWNSIYYGTMFQIDERLEPTGSSWADALRQLAIGMCVGMAATCFNAPFDVVKSRFQSQLLGAKRYHRVFPTLAAIAREEGPAALYKGFLPKALRLGLGQTVGLIVFQNLLRAAGVGGEAAEALAA